MHTLVKSPFCDISESLLFAKVSFYGHCIGHIFNPVYTGLEPVYWVLDTGDSLISPLANSVNSDYGVFNQGLRCLLKQ